MESINLTNTLAGLAAIQRAMAGEDILFTKLEIGDGVLTNTDVSGMTGLVNKTKDYVLGAVKAEDSEIVRLRSNISNAGVTQDLIIREYGIYAKFENEQEFLFAYLNVGDLTTPLPNQTIGRYELNRDFILYIGNSLHVDFTSNGHLIYVSVNQYKDDMKTKANVIKSISELKTSNKYKNGDVVKVLENGLVFEIKEISTVGFEDELHFRLANGVYANLYLDASDFSWIIKRQNELVAKYLDINARNLELKITLQGDSITYGHDTVSSDVIAAPTDILPDGSTHSFTRSPRPINISLQKNLREIYGRENITVENRGYSGDYAKRSYERWRTSNNSNITMFLLGQNDSGASYVPEDQRTYNAFYKWNLMLAIREIIRGSAVIFTDGYNTRSNNGGDVRATFMEMNSKIAETIGVLFLETSTMLYGCNKTFFSDGVHLNTKGNDRMGARLTPFFVNKQMLDPVKINANDYLGINTDLAQTRANGATISSTSGSAGIITGLSGEDENSYSREVCQLTLDSQALYATFYLNSKSTILNILGGYEGAEVEIDFGNEQAYCEDNYNMNGVTHELYESLPPSFYARADGELPAGKYTATRIPILGRGWHTVRIRKCQGSDNTFYINGLKFIERTQESIKYMDINNFKLSGEENIFNFTIRDLADSIEATKQLVQSINRKTIFSCDKISGTINGQSRYQITHFSRNSNNAYFAIVVKIFDSSFSKGTQTFYFDYLDNTLNLKNYFSENCDLSISQESLSLNDNEAGTFIANKLNSTLAKELKIRNSIRIGFSYGGYIDLFRFNNIDNSTPGAITAYRYCCDFAGTIKVYNFTIVSGVVTFDSTSKIIPTTVYQLIDTPYYTIKMEEEGVYQDFRNYMDSKHEYDYNQRENEKQKILAYKEATKENPNLTYKQWLSEQPMMLPTTEPKPQPSKALTKFIEKYIG